MSRVIDTIFLNCYNDIKRASKLDASLAEWSKAVDLSPYTSLLSKDA